MQCDENPKFGTRLRHEVGTLVIAALMLAPATLVAAEPLAPGAGQRADDLARVQAKERYKKGVEAYGAGRYKDAIDLFLEANRLSPEPSLSYNIGVAYQDMGDVAAAMRWFRDYLRRIPQAQDRVEVEKKVDELQQHLRKTGVQQVTVLSTPEGATVVVDGRPVGVTPWTGEIPPGTHNVTLQLRGHADADKRFELLEHRAMDVEVVLAPLALPATSTVPVVPFQGTRVPHPAKSASVPATTAEGGTPPDRGGRAPGVITWGMFGVSAAAFAGALGFELARRSAESDARDYPTRVGALERYDTMVSRQSTARILAGVGAATLIAGGALLYFDLTREPPGKAPAAARARIGVGWNAPGCGANVIIRFF
ncbi:MAG: PEGA domain-containing protein [Deltaproteobacteria bacterium]|nr:PEGA domain-containing protein [Deltaproteobacteria bacterium]